MQYSIFFSRPPQVTLALKSHGASSPFEEYSLCARMQEKSEAARRFFSVCQPYRSTRRASGCLVRVIDFRRCFPCVTFGGHRAAFEEVGALTSARRSCAYGRRAENPH